jgi:hypothetical protein
VKGLMDNAEAKSAAFAPKISSKMGVFFVQLVE